MSGQNPNQPGGSQLDPQVQRDLDPNVGGLDPNDPNVARDPVCGMLVDKRTATDTLAPPVNSPGETIYFCSPECKAVFEEDPSRYGSNF